MNRTKKMFIFISLAFLLFYPQVLFAQVSASPSVVKKSSRIQQDSQYGQAGPEAGNVKPVQGKSKSAIMPLEQKKNKARERLSQPEKKRGQAEADVKPEKKQVIQTEINIATGKEISPIHRMDSDIARGDLAKDKVPIISNEELFRKKQCTGGTVSPDLRT
jgi:hypothetical protein